MLYVYAERSVYSPGSTAVFRVLAIDVESGPASGVSVLATVYDPNSAEVSQFEGVTDDSGWFFFTVVLEIEGYYRVTVQDVSAAYVGSEVSVLVCSDCPYDASTVTVISTATVTTSLGTVTSIVWTTVVSAVTNTVYTTILSSYWTTVYETIFGTAITTVVSTSTVRSVEFVETTRTATVFRTGTVTVQQTVGLTETVKEFVVSTLFSTFVSTVVGVSDGGLTATAIFVLALALLVLAVVLYVVRRVVV